jgi:O-antigen/teichoic acid export membrane protein
MVLGTLAGSCASVVALAPAISRWPRLRFSPAEFRKLAAFGAFFSVERLMWGVLLRVFGLVIGYVHGVVVLGYFQFAQRLIDESANLIQTFVLRFGLSFFSALERAGKDPTDAFLKATLLITAVAAPIFTGVALVMPDLVGTVFAAKWAPAVVVSQVAAVSWAISFPRALVGSVLRARGRQGALALYAAVTCVLTILAGLLTGGHSLLIVALAWATRYLVGIPWSMYAIDRYLGISPRRQIAASMRPMIAAALMAGVVVGVSVLLHDFAPVQRLAIEVATGAATYMIVLALIDRATLRLGLSLLADMRRMMRTA